jgi:hypothetical protein
MRQTAFASSAIPMYRVHRATGKSNEHRINGRNIMKAVSGDYGR